MEPELRIHGPQAWITLRRPEQANRLERRDLHVMLEHLSTVQADAQVRVLVLQSQGPHFCSGFNLEEVLDTEGDHSAPAHFARVADALERARPVTVAAVQGGAFGGAVDLALACDFRVGTPEAVATVPAVRLGLQFYRSGLQRAVARLPWAVAQRLYLLGHRLEAAELVQAGYFIDLADGPQALAAEVQRLCDHLLAMGPAALLGIKRALVDIASGRAEDPEVALAIDASAADTERSEELRRRVQAWQSARAGAVRSSPQMRE